MRVAAVLILFGCSTTSTTGRVGTLLVSDGDRSLGRLVEDELGSEIESRGMVAAPRTGSRVVELQTTVDAWPDEIELKVMCSTMPARELKGMFSARARGASRKKLVQMLAKKVAEDLDEGCR